MSLGSRFSLKQFFFPKHVSIACEYVSVAALYAPNQNLNNAAFFLQSYNSQNKNSWRLKSHISCGSACRNILSHFWANGRRGDFFLLPHLIPNSKRQSLIKINNESIVTRRKCRECHDANLLHTWLDLRMWISSYEFFVENGKYHKW